MMRRHSVFVAFLVVLVVCCGLAMSSTPAFAAEKVFVANDAAFSATDVRGQKQQQQLDGRAPQMERGGHEVAKDLGAVSAHAAAAAASPIKELAANDSAIDSAAVIIVKDYGPILSGGVIASAAVVLVFACFLVVLVMIEMGTIISDFVEHRLRNARRISKCGDDPAEPQFGELRDTAGNWRA